MMCLCRRVDVMNGMVCVVCDYHSTMATEWLHLWVMSLENKLSLGENFLTMQFHSYQII